MLKTLVLAATVGAFALAGPAFAQPAPAKADKPAATKSTKKAHAKRTCWDLAYESQAQKDCLAKGDAAKSGDAMAKPKAKKAAAKKAA
jgi:hypothetical protein